ncbi:hypothetical protein SAMN05421805_108130 [Saccharopolyspora antimicrobica]|uniref:Uncharacterized protein n=1 Tax=Saccharopolyspora antimicrobica TaxID=455193 RepID=A0A1I5DGC2_9PSEU|nr:hypothetical protein [Saccharopolyspora antimicrobica]RKT85124.1 hypothetical protein ATL45_3460 [Saccharopolyspora antimicrobica]SFN98309.1 hypothetical protein SAMN05421805_108130 [Saccharopolyspora antimicrobica]
MVEWIVPALLSIAVGAGTGTGVAFLMTRKIAAQPQRQAVPPHPPQGFGNPYQQ